MRAIHLNHAQIDFRESDILRLHEMLMSVAGYEYGGQYKTDDNVILEVDGDGNRRIRFRPTPAAETSQAMKQLTLAYLEARNDANINQLLLIPCVILDFLCIYPFRDGNGPKQPDAAFQGGDLQNSAGCQPNHGRGRAGRHGQKRLCDPDWPGQINSLSQGIRNPSHICKGG